MKKVTKKPAPKTAKKPIAKVAKKDVKKVVAKKPAVKAKPVAKPQKGSSFLSKVKNLFLGTGKKAPAKKAKPAAKKVVAKKPVVKAVKKLAPKKAVKKVVAKKPLPKPVKKAVAKKVLPKAKTAKKKVVAKVVKKVLPKKPIAKVYKPVAKKVISKPLVKSKDKKVANIPVKKIVKPVAIVAVKQQEKKPVKTIEPKQPLVVASSDKKIEKPINQKPTMSQSKLNAPGKSRYSDAELEEFKQLIDSKILAARDELKYLQEQVNRKSSVGDTEADTTFSGLEDGTASMEREYLNQMASRQITYISHLEKALIRIQNKTYGICRETGTLIPKERLRVVPHATLSIEAKLAKEQ
jgi:RNA polymerase-binding transcription factor DksA